MAYPLLTSEQIKSLQDFSSSAYKAFVAVESAAARLKDSESRLTIAYENAAKHKELLAEAQDAFTAENRRLTLFVGGYAGPGGHGLCVK